MKILALVLALNIAAFAIPVPTCPPDTQDCNIDNILQCGGAPKCFMPTISLYEVTAVSQFHGIK